MANLFFKGNKIFDHEIICTVCIEASKYFKYVEGDKNFKNQILFNALAKKRIKPIKNGRK